MSAFTSKLTITEYEIGVRLWRLETPLTYEVGDLGSGRLITVPTGYITDGASVPRWLWWCLPAWGRYSRAAVVHDLLCTLGNRGKPHVEAPTRRVADAVFYEAMDVCGVSLPVRLAMWVGVRVGAWLPGVAANDPHNQDW